MRADSIVYEMINIKFTFDNIKDKLNGKDILKDYFIEDLNIKIKSGEFVSIVGPNGSGKTTLIKLMLGFYENYKGVIKLYKKDLKKFSRKEIALIVSYLSQFIPETIPFKVDEILIMGRYPFKKFIEFYNSKDYQKIKEIAKDIGIEDLINKKFDNLSGGEKRLILIAQSLVKETPVVILDEPDNHLDIMYRIKIYELLKKLNKEFNKTIITISHDLNMAFRFAERIVFMKNGKIVKDGKVKEVVSPEIIKKVFDVKVKLLSIDERPVIIY